MLLMLDYSYELWQKQRQLSTINALNLSVAQAKKKLAEMTHLGSENAGLEETIKKMRQQVNTNGVVMTTLLIQNGFSNYLSGLANAMPAGVWLTHIDMTKSGEKIELTGSSLQASTIQVFVQQLGKQPEFSGKKFKIIELTQITPQKNEQSPYFNFHITGDI